MFLVKNLNKENIKFEQVKELTIKKYIKIKNHQLRNKSASLFKYKQNEFIINKKTYLLICWLI